jgi:hypothetical protein
MRKPGRQSIAPGNSKVREGSGPAVPDNTTVVENLLKFGTCKAGGERDFGQRESVNARESDI